MSQPSAALINPPTLSVLAKEIGDVSKDSLQALNDYHLVLAKVPYLREKPTFALKYAKLNLDKADYNIRSSNMRMTGLETASFYIKSAKDSLYAPSCHNAIKNLDIKLAKIQRQIDACNRSHEQCSKDRGDAYSKFLQAEFDFYSADSDVKRMVYKAKDTAEDAVKKASNSVIDITGRLEDVVPQVVEHTSYNSSGFGQVILFLGVTLVLFVGVFYAGRWSNLKK